jgi:hypothetical protein
MSALNSYHFEGVYRINIALYTFWLCILGDPFAEIHRWFFNTPINKRCN